MNNPIINLLATTNWWFVVVGVVVSSIVGMIRYSPTLFGHQYGKRMGIKMEWLTDAEKKAGMMRSMPREILSRILYFIGLGQALQMWGRTDMTSGLLFAMVVWAVFILPANMSQTAWSTCNMQMLRLIAWNTLLSTLLTTALWYILF